MYIPLEPGEEVVMKVHRHWIFIAMRIVGLAFLLALPIGLFLLVSALDVAVFSGVSFGALVTFWALWGLVCWATFWQFWTTYYMDIWVVTNKRIIDIDYERLFDRSISEIQLERVQDMRTRVTGIMGTLLKYGSLTVQSAGTREEFIIDQIADPDALRQKISGLL